MSDLRLVTEAGLMQELTMKTNEVPLFGADDVLQRPHHGAEGARHAELELLGCELAAPRDELFGGPHVVPELPKHDRGHSHASAQVMAASGTSSQPCCMQIQCVRPGNSRSSVGARE